MPHDFDALIASIEAADDCPQILNGKPAPGVADALKALKKNRFHSYYGTKNKFGMEKKHFSKDFKKVADKPHVYNNMLGEEKNVTVSSANGREHAMLFVDMLYKSISYAKVVCPDKYEEAMDLYVTVATKPSRKVRFAQLKDNDDMSTKR